MIWIGKRKEKKKDIHMKYIIEIHILVFEKKKSNGKGEKGERIKI